VDGLRERRRRPQRGVKRRVLRCVHRGKGLGVLGVEGTKQVVDRSLHGGQERPEGFLGDLVRRGRLVGRAAGQELLLSAERRMRDVGGREALALAFAHDYSYPFYHLAFGYLSDRLGHVMGLLGINGYKVAPEGTYSRREEVFFDWRGFDMPTPEPPVPDLRVEVERKGGLGKLPNVRFHLRQGADHVGVCETYCAGHWTRAAEAQETSFVTWLGVNDDRQGRGWGRFLLLSALYELRQVGYSNSAISTNLTNYRAMTFYANLGYEVVGNGYEFTKSLV
ncbi:MAG: GNAT family N-acetyltransferase, partial [Candidatus Poribacteria bacterium]